MLVILLIFGFGLAGASYDTCKDTLSNNGYNFSDSQFHSFYEAANDPDNIYYINTHTDTLANDWASITSGDTSLSEWYDNYVFEASGNTSGSLSSVDSQWVENGLSESVTVWDSDLRSDAVLSSYGKNKKLITDGHGGYYIAEFTGSLSDKSLFYKVTHVDFNGNSTLFYNTQVIPTKPESSAGTYDYTYNHFDFYVVENPDGSQTVTVINDYKTMLSDGEAHPFSETRSEDFYFSDPASEDIVEEKGDQVDLAVNPDGSVTLPDGTVVYPNADGTYTIGGTDYSPSKVIPNINDLLKQLLDLQEQIKELDNSLQFEKDNADSLDVSESVDSAVGAYEGDLSEFLLNSRITQVFPFCLPFDFVRGMKLLSTSPVPPKFDINFDIPSFGAYPGTHNVITLDLGLYSKYFTVVRWVTTILFILSLCFLTYKLIKW